jgi:anti-sigma28 factor (negative regulator of flagellin synthesis)
MKINPASGANYIPGGYKVGKSGAYGKTGGLTKSDEASLSSEAMTFSRIMSSIRRPDETENADEASRIASIREQVQAGNYSVNSDAVADSILGNLFG